LPYYHRLTQSRYSSEQAGSSLGVRQHQNRGIGWEYVQVCIDDATGLAYVEVLSDEKGTLRWAS